MKKLMVMMAAVATGFAAWASALIDPVTYTVDQNLAVGPTNIVGYSDDLQKKVGDHDAVIHWWMDDFTVDTDEDPISIAEDSEKGKVLQLETGADTPVLRTFNPLLVTTATTTPVIETEAVDIQDHGTFIDTWVKLSASEGVQEPVEGDKISIWLQVVDEETDDQGEIVVPASTNLVVTCGALDDQFLPTPTNIVLDADVEPDTWHRITIRAVKQIAADTAAVKNIGFVVFLDEGIVAAKEGVYLDFTGIALSDKAQTYAQNRQLFPSLQQDTAATLTAAGFAGVGQIASVNLDTQYSAPAFAKDPTFVKFTWDANVASIKIDDTELITNPGTAGEFDYQVTAFGSEDGLTAEVAYNDTPVYKMLAINGSNFAVNNFSYNAAGTEIAFLASEYAAGQIDITSQLDRQGAEVYVQKGSTGEFEKLGSALPYVKDIIGAILAAQGEDQIDASDTVKIVLLENEVATTTGDWSTLAPKIILDLNGHSLTASENWTGGWPVSEDPLEDYSIFNYAVVGSKNDLTIMDSQGGGSIVGRNTGSSETLGENAVYAAGTLVIGESAGAAITFTGAVAGLNVVADEDVETAITVRGGRYTAEVTEDERITVTLNDGENALEWVPPAEEGGYYTLAPVGADVVSYSVGSEATADLVITINDVAAAASGNITAGSVLKVVATAKTGYQYTGSEQHGADWSFANNAWTFTTTAVAGTPITVTVPTATLIPAANVVSIQVNGGDATGYADVATALAAVQLAEGDAANFPIVVTALADGVVVNGPNSQTLTLNTGDEITITADGWTFAANITGNLVLEPGKSIIATAASASAITAPAGYMIVTSEVTGGVKYEAKEILATVKIGEAAAVNFCDLAAVLEAVQAAEVAGTFPIVVTAVGEARTFAMGAQSITLGQDEKITIAKAGSWQFSNLFVGKVLLVAGNEIIAKGIADGSEILVDEANGYELKDSEPVDEYITYTAELKTLTATFMVEGAQEPFDVQDVTYGEMAVAPDPAPTKTGYTFTGWTPAFAALTANQIYTAQFSPNPATLTLPTLPTGATEAKVYQKANGATDWAEVTVGESGTYAITAGNFYKVAVTADTGYERVGDGELVSQAAVTAGETITIEAADLAALVQLHNYTITYKQVNGQLITGLDLTTFTIADAVVLPTSLGQLGGTLEGWYANAELTGDPITGWAAGAKTADVIVYAKIQQVVDEPAEIVKDKVDTTGLDDTQAAAAKVNATIIYTAKGNNKAAAEAWITSVYGEGNKIPGAKLAAASAENVKIAVEYCIEIMETPVVTFTTSATPTEGNAAAFTFQIKDGASGDPISLEAAETASKVLSMVKYCSTLGSWAPATAENVAVSVDGSAATVQLVKKNGVAAGFMKVVLTPPAE